MTSDKAKPHDEAADRVAIHELLVEYGASIDRRDFKAFGELFGEDGVYVAGGTTVGAEACEAQMRHVYATGPNATRTPNFHLFFNELVWFDGPDNARSTSQSLFITPGENGSTRPMIALSGRYEDELVRKNGRWLFARRTVKLNLNP